MAGGVFALVLSLDSSGRRFWVACSCAPYQHKRRVHTVGGLLSDPHNFARACALFREFSAREERSG
ncbi:hypothetical protein, partial [Treponema pallidum]